jgi:protoporphyrinogen oxidase
MVQRNPATSGPSIGIIGGGIMGVSAAYFLSRRGFQVELFEAAETLGGLAGGVALDDGTVIDRFYHAIMSSDAHLQALAAELGIRDRLRFRETRMGVYYEGAIHSMSNVAEFLRFPPLTWADRLRLGLTVIYAQSVRDWRSLEGISAESWLVRLSGRRVYERLWRPMLRAKFDGVFDRMPATYVWSRLVRTKSGRSGLRQRELAGHLIGGYPTLLEAMVARIQSSGGRVWTKAPVQQVVIREGRALGLARAGETRHFDAVLSTLPLSVLNRLLAAGGAAPLEAAGAPDYFGIVCGVLVLDRPLTGFWTLNIADERIPFTGVIETTAYIDPVHVGGHHLVYLPKYTAPGSELLQRPDDEIRQLWMSELLKMFPAFETRALRQFLVFRERYVQPVLSLNSSDRIPPIHTSIPGLYLATTAQIYPEMASGESVTRFARAAAQRMATDLGR